MADQTTTTSDECCSKDVNCSLLHMTMQSFTQDHMANLSSNGQMARSQNLFANTIANNQINLASVVGANQIAALTTLTTNQLVEMASVPNSIQEVAAESRAGVPPTQVPTAIEQSSFEWSKITAQLASLQDTVAKLKTA
jgi:hypothetical protein